MLFIGDAQGGKPVYPGVAAFAVPASLSDSFEVDISRDFGVRAVSLCILILHVPYVAIFSNANKCQSLYI